MADPTPAPVAEQDAFDAAFAEALKDDAPAPAPAAAGTAQDPPGGEKSAEPAPASVDGGAAGGGKDAAAAGGEKPAVGATGEEAAAAVETAAAAAAEPAPAAAAPAQAAETPEAELTRLRAELAAFKAFAPKQAEPAPAAAKEEPAPAAAPKIADPKWYQPTEDEAARLANFQKDWPDIAEATAVATKQAAYNVAEYIFNQIAKTYNPTIEQFAQLSHGLQEQLALTALRSEHKDYDSIYDNVVAWVDTLPAPFKRGALEVMESGTPDEVSQLIQSYKNATGTAAPAGTPVATAAGGAPTPAPSPAGLSAAAKKAASKLQVVGSKRTTPTPQADANDFDGAWAEALRSTGN